MSNVIPLFKSQEPVVEAGTLTGVMSAFEDVAYASGVDVGSQKFLYACSTIMTLMQIELNNK